MELTDLHFLKDGDDRHKGYILVVETYSPRGAKPAWRWRLIQYGEPVDREDGFPTRKACLAAAQDSLAKLYKGVDPFLMIQGERT